MKSALGGWELSGIVTMESGLPLNITLGGSQGSNGIANATNRPNINGSISYPTERVAELFNTSVFSTPALGHGAISPRGRFAGPGRDNWNLSLFKSFRV